MYTKQIPYKDFHGKPQNKTIHLNLTETEVFKLLGEFKQILEWRDSINTEDIRQLDTAEVIAFYNALEEILLSSYGIPSSDGQYFDKTDRYRFQTSALFNAVMLIFVTDPAEATKMVDELLPKNMQDLVKTADANMAAMAKSQGAGSDQSQEIERLRAQLAAAENGQESPTAPAAYIPPQQ